MAHIDTTQCKKLHKQHKSRSYLNSELITPDAQLRDSATITTSPIGKE